MKLKLLVPLLIAIGIGLGLAYAWLLSPVKFTEASPAQVITEYRHAWLIMAAEAYAEDGNWSRTQERINSLLDPTLSQTITQLFDQYNAQGPNPIARALALLADRYNARTAAMLVYLATPIVPPVPIVPPDPIVPPTPIVLPTLIVLPTPIVLPDPTITPRPQIVSSPTPTLIPILPSPAPTLIPIYEIVSQNSVCRSNSIKPQIQVTLQDANGFGMPGKEVWILWDAGADRFVTGLKPEIEPGYGDFDMSIDQTYSVAIDKPTTVVVTGLHADECNNGHLTWQLTLKAYAP